MADTESATPSVTACVTGASGYLGGAFAKALAEAGATVIASSRDRGRAEAAAAALSEDSDVTHHAVELDHQDAESIDRGFAKAVDKAGRIDVLVNNGHEALDNDWTDVTPEQFTRQLANATGYFQLARRVRDHAVERGGPASVIMLGSMYGLVASYPEARRMSVGSAHGRPSNSTPTACPFEVSPAGIEMAGRPPTEAVAQLLPVWSFPSLTGESLTLGYASASSR